MITVRDSIHGDEAEVRSLVANAFLTMRDIYRPRPDSVASSARLDLECEAIVAHCDGILAGAAYVYSEGTAMHVTQLAVLLDYRRRGIARQLLTFADGLALDSGLSELRLTTVQETGNVGIFERLGFSVFAMSEAAWCVSDQFPVLNDVQMHRRCE